ncbi:MAG: hypothetical protein EOO46_14190 [Flavobacterium sp.]|nr:MAG: hypothetical protein EOO46_14190 [Flavobacterium sp.]
MRQSTTSKQISSIPELKAIRGALFETSPVENLVNAAWNFAYSSLWNSTYFSTREINIAKEKIEEYFTLVENPRSAFLSFCQRVLLARQYVNGAKGRFMPLPSVWFDKNNEYGFVGTKDWYTQIKQVRLSLPAYKEEIKALAEAILEYGEEPSAQNFTYWRNYFIERGTPGLLNLFQVAAINQQYLKA